MSSRTVINVNKDTYEIIKSYCNKNGLIIYKWSEKILLKKIKENLNNETIKEIKNK